MSVRNLHMYASNIQFTETELLIVKFIFKHYRERFNPRQLAKLLGINHAHAHKLCNDLRNKQLLVREDIGNAIYYTFDYDNDSAISFMEYLLSVEQLPEMSNVSLSELKNIKYVTLGLIFGPSMKNEKFNDVDVLFVYNSKHKDKIKVFKQELFSTRLLKKPTRFRGITEEDLKNQLDNETIYKALTENIILMGAKKYVEIVKNAPHKQSLQRTL